MPRKMTVQDLANLCNYSWEVERAFGFNMKDPVQFQDFISNLPVAELKVHLESLSELFRTVREIGYSDIELKAEGTHPYLAQLGAFRTPAAAAIGADENIVVPALPVR